MLRERLTITLDPELLRAIDETTDRSRIRNRSHAIEYLLKKGLDLERFHTAFLFFEENWQQEALEAALIACQKVGIYKFFLSGPTDFPVDETNVLILESYGKASLTPQIQLSPNNFGSGGVILLQKEALPSSFAIFYISKSVYSYPLTAALAFHHNHGQIATQLITRNGTDFSWTGAAILEPTITNYMNIGVIELPLHTFPKLIAANQLKTYVC